MASGDLSALSPASISSPSTPDGIIVSPDGLFAYSINESNVIRQFAINPTTGLLSALTPAFVSTSSGARYGNISPDGKSFYVGYYGQSHITGYSRNLSTGLLTVIANYSCATHPGRPIVSPDNANVYVGAQDSGRMYQFSRDTSTGVLTALSPAYVTCASGCWQSSMSPDGTSLYTGGYSGTTLGQFSRDTATGLLTALSPATVTTGTAPSSQTTSTDGLFFYAANGSSGTISQFSRNPTTGALTSLVPASIAAGTGSGLNSIFVTPDNKNILVGRSGGALFIFDRNTTTGLLSAHSTQPSIAAAGGAGIASTPDGKFVYSTNGSLSVIKMFSRALDSAVINQTCSATSLSVGISSYLKGTVFHLTAIVEAVSSAFFSSIKTAAPSVWTTPGQYVWTVPDGVTTITVEGIAGGQSGVSRAQQYNDGGWGGAYAKSILSVSPGQTVYVSVGQGGAAIPFYGPAAGPNNGTDTWVNINENVKPDSNSYGIVAAANGGESVGSVINLGGEPGPHNPTMGQGDAGDHYSGGGGGGGGGPAGPGSAGIMTSTANQVSGIGPRAPGGPGIMPGGYTAGHGGGGCWASNTISGEAGGNYGGGSGGAGTWAGGSIGSGCGAAGNGIVVISFIDSPGTTFTQSCIAAVSSVLSFIRQGNKVSGATSTSTKTISRKVNSSRSDSSTSIPLLLKSIQTSRAVSSSSIASALASIGAVIRYVTALVTVATVSTVQKAINSFKSVAAPSTTNQSKAALLNKNVIVSNTTMTGRVIYATKTLLSTSIASKLYSITKFANAVGSSAASVKKAIDSTFTKAAITSIASYVSDVLAGTFYQVCSAVSTASLNLSKSVSSTFKATSLSSSYVTKLYSTVKNVVTSMTSSLTKTIDVIRNATSTSIAYRSKTFEMVIELIVASNATISRRIGTVFSTIVTNTFFAVKSIKVAFADSIFGTASLKKDVSQNKSTNVSTVGSFGKMVDLVISVISTPMAFIQKLVRASYSALTINTSSARATLKQLVSTLISFFVTIGKSEIENEEVIVTEKQINTIEEANEEINLELLGQPEIEIKLQ